MEQVNSGFGTDQSGLADKLRQSRYKGSRAATHDCGEREAVCAADVPAMFVFPACLGGDPALLTDSERLV
jgi:hypothetical protein